MIKIVLATCLITSLFANAVSEKDGSSFKDDLFSGRIPLVQTPSKDNMAEPTLSYDEVIKLYENKEYERAGNMFLALMLQGDYRGAAYIAEIYEKGLAGVKDCNKAKFILLYAISKNHCVGYEKLLDWIKNDICIEFKDEAVRDKRIKEYEAKLNSCKK